MKIGPVLFYSVIFWGGEWWSETWTAKRKMGSAPLNVNCVSSPLQTTFHCGFLTANKTKTELILKLNRDN